MSSTCIDGNSKRRRISSSELCQDTVSLPTLTADPDTGLISSSDFHDAFDEYQAVYLPKCATAIRSKKCSGKGGSLSWKDIAGLFDSLVDDDKGTFCVENAAVNGDESDAATPTGHLSEEKPSDFLRSRKGSDDRRGYCSFLVQDPSSLSNTLSRLPLRQLPLAPAESQKEDENDAATIAAEMRHGPCVWIFFGRNGRKDSTQPAPEPLEGRPEHTDSVSHDGTWHYQLSGIKEWSLRPTKELLKRRNHRKANVQANKEPATALRGSDKGRVIVKCSEGDVLLVNTRLWWHKTIIPPQLQCDDDGVSVPSVSFARDVYFDNKSGLQNAMHKGTGKMSNLDGLYSADDIEANTIIFTEQDMPDCELYRSATDPNCEVVQLDDGIGAIISRRAITAGEFFCIAESSDEEEEQDEDDGRRHSSEGAEGGYLTGESAAQ